MPKDVSGKRCAGGGEFHYGDVETGATDKLSGTAKEFTAATGSAATGSAANRSNVSGLPSRATSSRSSGLEVVHRLAAEKAREEQRWVLKFGKEQGERADP